MDWLALSDSLAGGQPSLGRPAATRVDRHPPPIDYENGFIRGHLSRSPVGVRSSVQNRHGRSWALWCHS